MIENKLVKKMNYSRTQIIILMLLRLVLGYHFLFEGVDKLFSQSWSSYSFLMQANWLFSDLFQSLADSQTLLAIIDFMNIWGQILIGLGLLLGLFSRWAAFSGALLLLLYYVAIPPFVEGIFFIDKNLVELFAFLIIMLFPTSHIFGIDYLINNFWSKKNA